MGDEKTVREEFRVHFGFPPSKVDHTFLYLFLRIRRSYFVSRFLEAWTGQAAISHRWWHVLACLELQSLSQTHKYTLYPVQSGRGGECLFLDKIQSLSLEPRPLLSSTGYSIFYEQG